MLIKEHRVGMACFFLFKVPEELILSTGKVYFNFLKSLRLLLILDIDWSIYYIILSNKMGMKKKVKNFRG